MDTRRNTHQRDIIREVLKGNLDHLTAEEIFIRAKQLDSKISRATVYRNLAILEDEGEIRHLTAPFGPDHYDSILKDHYHCICKICGRVFDTKVAYLEELDHSDLGVEGFKLDSHDLIFIGTCEECAKEK